MLDVMKDDKNFLALTLAYPDGFPTSTNATFMLGSHTRVEIWNTGVIVFEPLQATTKDIILSSGVHGNETAPIELCNVLISDLLAEKLISRCRLMFLFGNPQAIIANTRFIDENLNRLFSGEHAREKTNNLERKRAKLLETYVERFYLGATNNASTERIRIHYDLHTAIRRSKYEKFAIYPFIGKKAYNKEQLCFLDACGINAVLFHHEPTTTFSYFSSHQYQAHAFTIELGKVFPMGQNKMNKFMAIETMLKKLITDSKLELGNLDDSKMHFYRVSRTIDKRANDFEFTFAPDVKNFTEFSKGEALAIESGQSILVEGDREAIVFPNANIPVGQRALLCLQLIGAASLVVK